MQEKKISNKIRKIILLGLNKQINVIQYNEYIID